MPWKMMDELGSLECSSSTLFLLPRSLGLASEMGSAAAAAFEKQDYDIESFFNIAALNNSKDCLEQAKVILNNSSDIPILLRENGVTGGVKNGKDHPQERRPALGRKRARFSLKPSTSPSLGNLDMKLSMLTDPEEFFSFHENLENADKELNRLLGRGAVLTDLSQQHQNTKRQRRPGILGKTANYKHPVPLHAGDVKTVVLSQEKVIEKGASIPSKNAIDSEPQNFSHLSNQSDISHELGTVTRSVADEGKGEKLLDTLLSSLEGLDEDEGVAFLQERLQFKPANVDKLRLPILNRGQSDDVGGVKSKEIVQKVEGSLFTHFPTLSRKTLATFSLLQGHFSQGDPPQDPHALPPTNGVPYTGNFSLIDGRNKKSLSPAANVDQPDIRILSSEGASTPVKENGRSSNLMEKLLSSITEPNKTAHSRIVMEEMLTGDSPCSLDLRTDHNPIRFDSNNNLRSPGSDGCVENKADEASVLKQQWPGIGSWAFETRNSTGSEGVDGLFGSSVSKKDMRLDSDVCVGLSGLCGNLEDEVNEILQEAPPSQAPEGLEDQFSPVAGTNLPIDARSEDFSTLPGQQNEELPRDSSVSMITQLQPNAPRNRKRSNIRRKSLAEAGMRWEAGVRRSTRIKTRPLEYWRGERLLFGRIHDSLATVIGIKYASPCKGGSMEGLKVKSYVPEKYAELVEKAALH